MERYGVSHFVALIRCLLTLRQQYQSGSSFGSSLTGTSTPVLVLGFGNEELEISAKLENDIGVVARLSLHSRCTGLGRVEEGGEGSPSA